MFVPLACCHVGGLVDRYTRVVPTSPVTVSRGVSKKVPPLARTLKELE
jgi:hypothetical protein